MAMQVDATGQETTLPQRTLEERNALVLENTGLVGMALKRYFHLTPKASSWEDLFQHGMMGLIRAAETWDESLGRFPTHAVWQIRGVVGRAIANEGTLIRIPSRFQKEERQSLVEKLQAVSLDWRRTHSCRATASSVVGDMPDTECGYTLSEAIQWALVTLPVNHARVIRLRYLEGISFAEIGKRMGISKQRVKQLEVSALLKLRCGASGILMEWLP